MDINGDFDQEGRVKTFSPMCWDSVKYDCFTVIGYKLFTDQPLWVFTNSDEDITQLVKSFNYEEYLASSDFYFDLTRHVEQRTLTDAFILQTLGTPDHTKRTSDDDRRTESWIYLKLDVQLTIEDGLVTACARIE